MSEFKDKYYEHKKIADLNFEGYVYDVDNYIKELETRIETKICKWIYQDCFEYFDTECGNAFHFIYDSIKENNFVYCPYCGGKIKEVSNEN